MMMDRGMPLAYHHHMGTVIETQSDTERLMYNSVDEAIKFYTSLSYNE